MSVFAKRIIEGPCMIDHTHDPAARCWIDSADHAEFPVQNLPFGVFTPVDRGGPRIGTAIGEMILDLRALAAAGLLPAELISALAEPHLNALFALTPALRLALRHALFALLTEAGQAEAVSLHLHAAPSCSMHLPFAVGDYTDFYVGIHHARAVGALFRPDKPLLPNYHYVPIGYHGRASSVQVSGAPVIRPNGQTLPPGETTPLFGPTRRLDYELELGLWVAGSNPLGTPVSIGDAWDRIGGLCLLNDWSARDVQAWEYQPLGPFLAKNFATTVSPWVVTREALAPFRTARTPRAEGEPEPLPYLRDASDAASGMIAIELEVFLETAGMRAVGAAPHMLSRSTTGEAMHWTPAQLVTHHASGGCNLAPGDLIGTGTLSGPDPKGAGSLLELTRGGREPIGLPGGEMRAFLEDGDRVTLRAAARREGFRTIGFGTCTGTVHPAPAT